MSAPVEHEWTKSPEWRQVAANMERRASFGQCTRAPADRDERRWNGVKP